MNKLICVAGIVVCGLGALASDMGSFWFWLNAAGVALWVSNLTNADA